MSSLPRILLADDSRQDAELILEALSEHDVAKEVLHVKDGAEALDFLYRRGPFASYDPRQPGVILLDVKMPKVDGLEVLKHVKSDPMLKRIPIVMMTSSREEQDLLCSYNLGAAAFVVKPLKFAEFVQAVKCIGDFWALLNEPPPGSVARMEI